jgi:hypothetical protein
MKAGTKARSSEKRGYQKRAGTRVSQKLIEAGSGARAAKKRGLSGVVAGRARALRVVWAGRSIDRTVSAIAHHSFTVAQRLCTAHAHRPNFG